MPSLCERVDAHRVQLTEQYIHVRGEVNSSTARARRRSQVGRRGRPGMYALEGEGQQEGSNEVRAGRHAGRPVLAMNARVLAC